MKKLILPIALLVSISVRAQKPVTKKEQDRQAILALAGCHNVTFDFAETFGSSKDYKYHDRYHETGTEYVEVVENTENKIVLQHLLVVTDKMIIKHWRQDWMFENTDLLVYDKDDKWVKTKLTPAQVKGQWTQKVSQVDDSPRYEGSASWVHVDGKHSWESTVDAPLPRREYTKRDDYNVLKRHNKIILTDDGGWLHEQDNQKILRANGKDSLLCWEKGFEKFTDITGDKCAPAVKWWEINNAYWKDVRTVWIQLEKERNDINLAKTVDEKRLYEALFELGDKQSQAKASSQENQKLIKETITKYFKA